MIPKALIFITLTASLPGARLFADDAGKMYDEGVVSIHGGKYGEAEETFGHALPLADVSLIPKILHNRGHARVKLGVSRFDLRPNGATLSPMLRYEELSLRENLDAVNKQILSHKKDPEQFDARAAGEVHKEGETHFKASEKSLPAMAAEIAFGAEALKITARGRDDYLGAVEMNPDDMTARADLKEIERHLKAANKEIDDQTKLTEAVHERSRELRIALDILKKLLPENDGKGEGDGDGGEGEKDEAQNRKLAQTEQKTAGAGERMSREEAEAKLESMKDHFDRRLRSDGSGSRRDRKKPQPGKNR